MTRHTPIAFGIVAACWLLAGAALAQDGGATTGFPDGGAGGTTTGPASARPADGAEPTRPQSLGDETAEPAGDVPRAQPPSSGAARPDLDAGVPFEADPASGPDAAESAGPDGGALDASAVQASAEDGGASDASVSQGSAEPVDAAVSDAAVSDPAVSAPAVSDPAALPSDTPDAASETGPGSPPTTAGPSQEVPWTTLLNELLFERAAREQRRAAPQPPGPQPGPAPTTVVNTPRDVDVNIVGCAARPELLGLGLPERRISTFGLVLLLGLAFLAIVAIDRLRRPLPKRGALPRSLGVLNMAARLSVVVILVMMVSRLLPAWLRPALLLTIAAVAVTIGFGAVWVVLPDVVAGIILVTERRVRPGLYLSGDGFRGTLERVSPRVTTLRAPDGTTLTVPNRALVKSRIRSSNRRWHELEVELTAPAGHTAPAIRRAIEDAVLSSPHIPPSPALVVSRDPTRPERWRVKTRLVDIRFVPDFEGQLLERVEDALQVTDAPD